MSNDQNAKKSIDTKSAILSPDQQAMLDSLIFCATTQESVNTAMTGADWREKAKGLATTASGLTVDYPMALLDEAAEFWASAVNFKWWAKTDFVFDRKAALDVVQHVQEEVDIIGWARTEEAAGAGVPEQYIADAGAFRIEVCTARPTLCKRKPARSGNDPETVAGIAWNVRKVGPI